MITAVIYAFVATFLFLFVIFNYLMSRQQLRERLLHLLDEDAAQYPGLRGIIRQFSVYCESASWARQKENLLIQAGIPFTGAEFMVISLGAAVLGALLLLMLTKGNLLLAIIGAMLGFLLPTMIVQKKIKDKYKLINEQLPAALSLMANSLRSGYSYMQAIDLVSKEIPEPLGGEFGIVVKEMNLGITTEDAFTNLVKRVNTEDLDLTVTAFLIQRQVGGNLAELIDNIAHTIRERSHMKQKIEALTAQGKISAWVLCLLPIGLLVAIYLLNPEYISSFIRDPRGKMLTLLGMVSTGIGVVWMQKIVDIEM